MNILKSLKKIIAEIMDVEEDEIDRETYLIRDLNMESIDLLELSVFINSHFKIDVNDDKAFLKDLRSVLKNIEKDVSIKDYLLDHYPHLDGQRIEEILSELDKGPVLKLRDVEEYIKYTISSYGK